MTDTKKFQGAVLYLQPDGIVDQFGNRVMTKAEILAGLGLSAESHVDAPIAGMEGPICASHAESWFCERNHLKGGMDAKCIVCAHEPNVAPQETLGKSPGSPQGEHQQNDPRGSPVRDVPAGAAPSHVDAQTGFADRLRAKLKKASEGQIHTWGFVAAFMEMIDEVEKDNASPPAPAVTGNAPPGLTATAQQAGAAPSSARPTGIEWRDPATAREALKPHLDETGAVDGCVVKLDVASDDHDHGPYLRQAWYDATQDRFVCSSTASVLDNVKAWAYDAEAA